MQHPFDALLDPGLPKGKGCQAPGMPPHAAGQQRLGIIRPAGRIHIPDHLFVAGDLDVPAEQPVGQPQQRMEPVHRQQDKAQGLPPVVAPADVGLLVGNDAVQMFLGKPEGQIDPRPQHPQHKGGVDPLALEDVVPQPHRRGQPAPQPQPADKGIEQHPRRPHCPDHSGQGQPDLQRIGAGGGLRRKGVLQYGIDRIVDGRHPAGDGGSALHADVGADGLTGGQQTENAFQRHRTDQPHRHQSPEQHPAPPGSPAQQQPRRQHSQHQPARRDAPVQQFNEQVGHFVSSSRN